MSQPRPPQLETICARPPENPPSVSTALSPTPQLSIVYRIAGLDEVDALYQGEEQGYVYARDGHPNATQLGGKIAEIEGAEAGLVFASGMAAEAALMLTLLDAGGHIALAEGVYGRTSALVTRDLRRFGVTHSVFDPTRPESLRDVLRAETRLVFVETLSNPLVRLADLKALAAVTHAAGAILAVDHTFAPLLCRPLELGADLVVHSATKLIGGHSDLTLGLMAGPKSLTDRVAPVASTFGQTGNPFESWLCLRGLATLGVRSTKACATALMLAQRLAKHPRVAAVHYPGLPTHPDHDRASRDLRGGFGTIGTIDLGSRERADRFIRSLRQIPFAPSLGDAATTLSHPATTSHRGQSPEQWARQGITPGLVRLSFGLEDAEDLWNDLEQALAT